MIRAALGILLVALAGLLALPASAQEVIRNFASDIVLQTDGSVIITETIDVVAQGIEIRRGIFRDIPTVLEDDAGNAIYQGLDVLSVTRDGLAEPYALESITNGERIRIGDPEVFLQRGPYRYEIQYRMERAARYFDTHDELYWNATGNFWTFPIEAATALVTLPEGVTITDTAVFTGAQDATGGDATIERVAPNQVRFTTNGPLGRREGMTFAIAMEKGVLVPPQGIGAAGYWLSDNRGWIVPLLGLLFVLLYNGLAWNAVGRDPAKGAIFPRFYPPEGYSPAQVHFIHNYGWKNSGWLAFSAALVSLATKDLVELEMEGKTNRILRTDKQPEGPLPPGEAAIITYLDGVGAVTIDKTTGPSLEIQRGKFTGAVAAAAKGAYFSYNILQIVGGLLIGAAALGAMVLLNVLDPEVLAVAVFIGIIVFVVAAVVGSLMTSSGAGNKFLGFVAILVAIVVFVSVGSGVVDFVSSVPVDVATLCAGAIVVVTALFSVIMRAPTVKGRKLMDEIDGFKMYLETAEKERLNFSGEPEMTTGRFEQILPYAMALGVEKPWSTRFENDLARNAVRDTSSGYHPRWYRGRSFSSGNFASTMGGIAGGLSAAMVAAQPAKSSSSGFSGGGGRSGGGGGGGGGGGW